MMIVVVSESNEVIFMTTTVDAVFENGIFKPIQPVTMADGTSVRLTIDSADAEDDPLDAVIGICTEGPDFSLAERHDDLLYGTKPFCQEQP